MDSNENKKKNKEKQKTMDEIKNSESEKNLREGSEIENASEPEAEGEKTGETDEKDLKISELEKELAEQKDKFLRKAAEFENYKRRSENDQLNLIKYSAENFILKILPVIDDLERSLQHIDTAKDIEAIKNGLKLVYDKLMKILEEQGVKKFDSVGQPFNVDYHEALMQRRDDSVGPLTVIDEIEKGYIYKDKIIRHAKVVVSEEVNEESVGTEDNTDNEKETGKE